MLLRKKLSASETVVLVMWPQLLLPHGHEHASPPDCPRPAPKFPGAGPCADRKEDEFGATNDIFERHVSDHRKHSAVGRIVTVIAHHEIVLRRHAIEKRVVARTSGVEVERGVLDALRQRLAPAPATDNAPSLPEHKIVQAFTSDRLSVDVEYTAD